MLKGQNRLRSGEVRAVLKDGRVLRGVSLTAKYIQADGSKMAVVVSKKIAKTAVRRNIIRRAVYSALPSPLPPRTWAVFLVQKNVPDYTSDIKTLCSKLFS